MLSSEVSVTAIIVNYNAGSHLKACLHSVLPQVKTVVVVDNASEDNSIDECKRAFSDQVNVIFILNKSNLGFSAACNIGLKSVCGTHVLFLNPDCQLEKDSVALLLKQIGSDLRVGMVGGLLLNTDGTEQAGGRRVIPTPWRAFVRAFGLFRLSRYWPELFSDFNLHKASLPDRPVEVEAISGACMLVRSEAIDDVGSWDEQYFLHGEDLDWCMRFRQKGWKVMFVPSARIVHASGVCSKKRPVFVEWHKHKGMILFYSKFYKAKHSYLLFVMVFLGVACHFSLVTARHYSQRTIRAIKKIF